MYNNCATVEPNRQLAQMKSWFMHPFYKTRVTIPSLFQKPFYAYICCSISIFQLMTLDWSCWTAPLRTSMGGQRLSPPFSSMRPTHQCSTAGCRELTFSSWEWGDISTLNLPQFKAVRTYELTSLFFASLGRILLIRLSTSVHLLKILIYSWFFVPVLCRQLRASSWCPAPGWKSPTHAKHQCLRKGLHFAQGGDQAANPSRPKQAPLLQRNSDIVRKYHITWISTGIWYFRVIAAEVWSFVIHLSMEIFLWCILFVFFP